MQRHQTKENATVSIVYSEHMNGTNNYGTTVITIIIIIYSYVVCGTSEKRTDIIQHWVVLKKFADLP